MAYEKTNIVPQDAVWIFISSGGSELRHLNDVILGVDSLKKINVPDKNIYIFSDYPQTQIELSSFHITLNIFDSSQFFTVLPTIQSSGYAFVIATGHGYSMGIPLGSSDRISPQTFIDSIRSIKNLKSAICVLGQCYAGVFNLIDAASDPKLVLLGGTNLNLSLSLPVTIANPIPYDVADIDEEGNSVIVTKGLSTWSANIFLFYFFEWIRHPKDIDGDGDCTIMDTYKYSVAMANDNLRQRKGELYIEIDIMKSNQLYRLVKYKNTHHTDPTLQIQQFLEIDSFQKNLNDYLEILYLHQEPWILHANYARFLIF